MNRYYEWASICSEVGGEVGGVVLFWAVLPLGYTMIARCILPFLYLVEMSSHCSLSLDTLSPPSMPSEPQYVYDLKALARLRFGLSLLQELELSGGASPIEGDRPLMASE